jgi:protein-S-isoprenylcysteine O-methyltransferase Ste14
MLNGTEDLFLRRAAVFASALVYWAGVWVQARRVRRQIGRSPNVAPRGMKERLLWAGWFVVVMVWMAQPFLVAANEPLPGFRIRSAWVGSGPLVAGVSLLGLGYAGTLWCYAAMDRMWRMGIDRAERTELVTRGPYRWVRHPIYLLQGVMLLGVLLLLPTGASLALVGIHLLCVLFKVADEEAHLRAVHGPAYLEYASRTGRLLPRVW